MADVSTQFAIQDRMTSKINAMINASERLNRTLDETDALTESVGDGRNYDEIVDAANRVADALDCMNQRQEDAANKVRKTKSEFQTLADTIQDLAVVRYAKKYGDQILDLSDSLVATRARLDLINDGLQTTEELQDMIMKSANRSRASYLSTADAVAKMGIMAKDAFSSNEELIDFAELINKQFTISGAEASQIDAAMLQLTQAMGSGVLRGEELNSIFEQAPTIVQTIADYLNVSIGKIREMASEGKITSTVVKNAMLASADEINAKFESMPMAFAQVWELAKNIALETFAPIITTIGEAAQWIYDNWSNIEPVFWGLAAAVLFYAVATWIADGAAKALFTTLMHDPIFWIALAIGALIAIIYKWIQSVGGLKVAWLIACNAILTAWSWVKIGFMTGVYWVMNLFNRLQLTFATVSTNIQNFLGDMKAGVLMILQNMVNGAIDIINDFINTLNQIPGANIGLIDQVTFGTTAQLENEAAKQARAADLAAYQDQINQQIADRDAALDSMKAQARAETAQREAEIATAKAEAAAAGAESEKDWQSYLGGEGFGGDVDNVGHVGSVGEIEEDVNIAEEDLKFLRDVAEMRYVQNFVTLTPTVAIDAQVSERVDYEELARRMERELEDEFVAAAEGVYA